MIYSYVYFTEGKEKHGYWKYGNLWAYAAPTSSKLNADKTLMEQI